MTWTARVKTGLEVLLASRPDLLAGHRIGLISHPAAVLPDLTASVDALTSAGVDLAALYGMEHGFAGSVADGHEVGHATDQRSGLPVYSLYGATREPSAEMLAGVDALLFDVQDVGVRFYTFISTLFYVLRAAGRHGCPVVVLDRPNPIGGIAVEGQLLEPGFESFVGIARLPIRHGLTVGELARFFNAEYALGADLTVVEMDGWRRGMTFDQTGLQWVPTSPAMPHLSTARVYPGMCLLEGTNVAEGRGTALPFEQCGAPWIARYTLAAALDRLDLPGVRFRPTVFQPSASKHAGHACEGVQTHVTDPSAFQPVATGLLLLATLIQMYRGRFEWASYERAEGERRYHFDALMGTDRIRRELDDASDPVSTAQSLIFEWAADEAEFRQERLPYLIYPPSVNGAPLSNGAE
jgi:beta-N-acetylhexosaminidase